MAFEERDPKRIIEDLEPDVERLKSLYQQYFMGIEKIPPTVLKKKVDRTIWALRRQRFQNTRVRFKFQQIIQRYNTYQQYWMRIMRQIENGTYKRDIVRAAKKYGKTEALTAAGRRAQAALSGIDDEPKKEEPKVWDLSDPSSAMDDIVDDAPTPPSRRGQQAPPAGGDYFDQLEQQLVDQHQQYRVERPSFPRSQPDDEVTATNVAAKAPALFGRPKQNAKPHPAIPEARPTARGLAPDEGTRQHDAAAPRVKAPAQPPTPPKRAKPPAAPKRQRNSLPKPAAPPARKLGPPPVAQAGGVRAGPPPRRRPVPGPVPEPRDTERGMPPDRPPPPMPKPPPAPPVAKAPRRPKPAPPGADQMRTKEIFDKYVTARQATGENTNDVTYDKLARSLEKQAKRLRQKHGKDRKVDFEVVTKDGKTMIRPVVK